MNYFFDKSTKIFPPPLLIYAKLQYREQKWSAKGSDFKEDDSALLLQELLLYIYVAPQHRPGEHILRNNITELYQDYNQTSTKVAIIADQRAGPRGSRVNPNKLVCWLPPEIILDGIALPGIEPILDRKGKNTTF